MVFEIYRTTAEYVIGAADAVLQTKGEASVDLVATFLDTTEESARNALLMACQLQFLVESNPDNFAVNSSLVRYFCTNIREQKAAILRFALEQYEPFTKFKVRLDFATGVVAKTATEIKAIYRLSAHRDDIASTLIDLGTYTNSLESQGAGLYLAAENKHDNYLELINSTVSDSEEARIMVNRHLGEDIVNVIEDKTIVDNLIFAYVGLSGRNEEPRAPIVYAANSVESYLYEYGKREGVNLDTKHGINAKAVELNQNGKMCSKHKNIFFSLGTIRNACDHGIDPETGKQWGISPETTIRFVVASLSAIRSLYDYEIGNFLI